MPDQLAVTTPAVSESAMLALYLMEMADMGADFLLMVHGIDTDTRERILARFTERGWKRNDDPSNSDVRGVCALLDNRSIHLWP
jgi:hypothetical protein